MQKCTSPAVLIAVMALIALAGCERKIINEVAAHDDGLAASACFTCHGDDNFALIAAQRQWANSLHASGAHMETSSSCQPCHTNEGFVAMATGDSVESEHFTPISCFTCHAPHTTGNLGLRLTTAVTLGNGEQFDRGAGNLCANCHKSRRDVNTYVFDGVKLTTRFGPHHSNQSDMLAGTGGYEYDGYQYLNSAHTGVADEGCIDCHMTATGTLVTGGHAFNMEEEEAGENLVGCNVSNCHGLTGELEEFNRNAVTDYDDDGTVEGVQDEVDGLIIKLQDRLLAAGLIKASGETYAPTNNLVVSDADSAGAVYNWLFAYEDRSLGVHNTKYAAGILQSSINFLSTGDPNGVRARANADLLTMH